MYNLTAVSTIFQQDILLTLLAYTGDIWQDYSEHRRKSVADGTKKPARVILTLDRDFFAQKYVTFCRVDGMNIVGNTFPNTAL